MNTGIYSGGVEIMESEIQGYTVEGGNHGVTNTGIYSVGVEFMKLGIQGYTVESRRVYHGARNTRIYSGG